MGITLYSKRCKIKDCIKLPQFVKGLCQMHYRRLRQTGSPLKTPTGRMHGKRNICIIKDCLGIVEGFKFCHKHYRKFKKYGNPLMVKRKHGNKKWTKEGYVVIHRPNHPYLRKDGTILEHRYIMEKKLDRKLSSFEIVHHKNGIRDDNRLENLEVLTTKTHFKGHSKIICNHCGKEKSY